jgi:hypothetical protein
MWSGANPYGPGALFKSDHTVAIDDVQSVGPTGVGGFEAVTEIVDDGGDMDTQLCGRSFRRRRFVP